MRAAFAAASLDNLTVRLVRAGYHRSQADRSGPGEESFQRRLGAGRPYPRFHLYVSRSSDRLALNLHLDQKQPSYAGSPAHGGEYDGPLVEQELERVVHSMTHDA